MKQRHTGTLGPATGSSWPCRIVTTGNPTVARQHPDGIRYHVVFPNGSRSPSYNRYHTCERIAADYNAGVL